MELWKLYDKSSEEDSEEKHIRRSPVYIKRISDFINYKSMGIKEPEEELVEQSQLLRECDRNEVDHGYKYVLKKRWRENHYIRIYTTPDSSIHPVL